MVAAGEPGSLRESEKRQGLFPPVPGGRLTRPVSLGLLPEVVRPERRACSAGCLAGVCGGRSGQGRRAREGGVEGTIGGSAVVTWSWHTRSRSLAELNEMIGRRDAEADSSQIGSCRFSSRFCRSHLSAACLEPGDDVWRGR